MNLYIHFSIYLYEIVFNLLSTDTNTYNKYGFENSIAQSPDANLFYEVASSA
jgi:hypothetical protein